MVTIGPCTHDDTRHCCPWRRQGNTKPHNNDNYNNTSNDNKGDTTTLVSTQWQQDTLATKTTLLTNTLIVLAFCFPLVPCCCSQPYIRVYHSVESHLSLLVSYLIPCTHHSLHFLSTHNTYSSSLYHHLPWPIISYLTSRVFATTTDSCTAALVPTVAQHTASIIPLALRILHLSSDHLSWPPELIFDVITTLGFIAKLTISILLCCIFSTPVIRFTLW